MDVRTKIVDQVLESLPELDQELRDKVERVLLVSLQEYEVQERCTGRCGPRRQQPWSCPKIYCHEKTGR